jgi:hypothetical protein
VFPPFMFWHLCVGLLEAGDDGSVAVLAAPALAAVVAAPDDDDVDDVTEDVCVVAALATARLPPSPTPSAPAPIAVVRAILPSLVFNVSASSQVGAHGFMAPHPEHPRWLRSHCSNRLLTV